MRLLLLTLLLLGTGILACERPLLVQVVHEPPTLIIKDGQPVAGLDYELVKAIFAEAGCPLRWLPATMSGARRLRSIETGEFDVLLNVSDVPERHHYGYYSQAYRKEVVGVFARPGSVLPPLHTLDNIYSAHLPLIAPLQGYYGAEFELLRPAWLKRQQLTLYKEPGVGVQLLFAQPKRAELLLIDADIYIHLAQKQHQQAVIWAMPPVIIAPVHLLLSRRSVPTAAVTTLNAAITRLRTSGRLAAIEKAHRASELLQLLEQPKP